MGLIGIYGNVGSGKTLFAVYLLHKHPNIQKYGNILSIKLPNYEPLDTLKLFDLEQTNKDVIVVWDEAYTEMDNRASLSLQSRINSYILMQQRKRNLSFIGLSQLNILDCRWRGLEKYAIVALDRPIKDKDGKDCTDDFNYYITDGIRKTYFTFPYKFAKNYFQYYESKELILPKNLQNLRDEVETMQDNKKLNELIDRYVLKIKKLEDVPKKITKDWIRNKMLRLDMNLHFCDYVYVRLKNE